MTTHVNKPVDKNNLKISNINKSTSTLINWRRCHLKANSSFNKLLPNLKMIKSLSTFTTNNSNLSWANSITSTYKQSLMRMRRTKRKKNPNNKKGLSSKGLRLIRSGRRLNKRSAFNARSAKTKWPKTSSLKTQSKELDTKTPSPKPQKWLVIMVTRRRTKWTLTILSLVMSGDLVVWW